jgi:hypothetical protein
MSLPAHLGIDVRTGSCPPTIPGARPAGPNVWCNDRQVLAHLGGGWSILVEDGSQVTVDGPPELLAADDGPTWILDSWAVNLAMLQRGHVGLHATAVRIGDVTVALEGPSGAGKSTTAVGLAHRGHDLLTDDVTLVDVRADGVWVLPYARGVHLTEEAASRLGLADAGLRPLAMFPGKSALRPTDHEPAPGRLAAVIALEPVSGLADVRTVVHSGAARLGELIRQGGRDLASTAIMGADGYFAQVTAIAQATPVVTVQRPAEVWSLDAVLDAVEAVAASCR